tara:strand:- start:771 stop:1193 length:423 start_codon:yes stop_codon:yes gene_type:complete
MNIHFSRKYPFSLLLLLSIRLFGQSENDSLSTTNPNEAKFTDEEQVSNDTLINKKSKNTPLSQEEKKSIVKSTSNKQDSLSLNNDSAEVLAINENWTQRFRNRKTQIVIASVPVIWLFYKYFQKKDDSTSLVGSPPNWPG